MAELTPDSILNLIYLVSVVVFIGYEQRIQASVMLVNVRRKLGRLESFRDSPDRSTRPSVITPASLDPADIADKLKHAPVVKMSSKEDISGMTSEITKAVEEASGNVRAIIVTETNPRDTIILAGIKNTIGIE